MDRHRETHSHGRLGLQSNDGDSRQHLLGVRPYINPHTGINSFMIPNALWDRYPYLKPQGPVVFLKFSTFQVLERQYGPCTVWYEYPLWELELKCINHPAPKSVDRHKRMIWHIEWCHIRSGQVLLPKESLPSLDILKKKKFFFQKLSFGVEDQICHWLHLTSKGTGSWRGWSVLPLGTAASAGVRIQPGNLWFQSLCLRATILALRLYLGFWANAGVWSLSAHPQSSSGLCLSHYLSCSDNLTWKMIVERTTLCFLLWEERKATSVLVSCSPGKLSAWETKLGRKGKQGTGVEGTGGERKKGRGRGGGVRKRRGNGERVRTRRGSGAWDPEMIQALKKF